MDPAAGTPVHVPDLDNAHRPGQRPLGPVGNSRQFRFGGGPAADFLVFPDHPVGLGLHPGDVAIRQGAAEIHLHQLRTHMEAHIFIAKAFVQKAGNDMLPGVLLGQVLPPGHVQRSLHVRPNGQRAIAPVENFAVLFLHIQHVHPAQSPPVAGLTAALREEGRPVQDHVKAAIGAPAVQHPCRKGAAVAVLII